MKIKQWRPLGPAVAAMLVFASVSPGLAHEAGDVDEAEADGLEVEIDRGIVMVGDPIEVEASFEVELDDESDHDEDDEHDQDGEAEDDEAGSDDEDESGEAPSGAATTSSSDTSTGTDGGTTDGGTTDGGTTDGGTTDGGTTDGGAGLPTSVVFTVDYGDGSPSEELTVVEQEADEEEFEAEAVGSHVYDAEGAYTVTVTATPDAGEAVTVAVTVAVTTDPVAYPRRTDVACPEGAVAPSGFGDVAAGSAHEGQIDCLATRGLLQGTAAGSFAPGATVTRAQMATFLVRLLAEAGVELPEAVEDAFDDDDGTAHEQAINQLAAAGLLTGSAAGEVAPQASLTRAQMATLLVRALETSGASLTAELDYFRDDDGSAHEAAINLAAAAGVGTGRQVLEFAPGERLTRAQLATFLTRALDLLLETNGAAA